MIFRENRNINFLFPQHRGSESQIQIHCIYYGQFSLFEQSWILFMCEKEID